METPIEETSLQPPPPLTSEYVRRIPPSQDCNAENMVTIETVSLRKGGWRNTDSILSDLRHIDPQIGVIIFYAILTAIIYYLYWKRFKNMPMAAMYTVSSIAIIAIAMLTLFGIDFFGALGSTIIPH